MASSEQAPGKIKGGKAPAPSKKLSPAQKDQKNREQAEKKEKKEAARIEKLAKLAAKRAEREAAEAAAKEAQGDLDPQVAGAIDAARQEQQERQAAGAAQPIEPGAEALPEPVTAQRRKARKLAAVAQPEKAPEVKDLKDQLQSLVEKGAVPAPDATEPTENLDTRRREQWKELLGNRAFPEVGETDAGGRKKLTSNLAIRADLAAFAALIPSVEGKDGKRNTAPLIQKAKDISRLIGDMRQLNGQLNDIAGQLEEKKGDETAQFEFGRGNNRQTLTREQAEEKLIELREGRTNLYKRLDEELPQFKEAALPILSDQKLLTQGTKQRKEAVAQLSAKIDTEIQNAPDDERREALTKQKALLKSASDYLRTTSLDLRKHNEAYLWARTGEIANADLVIQEIAKMHREKTPVQAPPVQRQNRQDRPERGPARQDQRPQQEAPQVEAAPANIGEISEVDYVRKWRNKQDGTWVNPLYLASREEKRAALENPQLEANIRALVEKGAFVSSGKNLTFEQARDAVVGVLKGKRVDFGGTKAVRMFAAQTVAPEILKRAVPLEEEVDLAATFASRQKNNGPLDADDASRDARTDEIERMSGGEDGDVIAREQRRIAAANTARRNGAPKAPEGFAASAIWKNVDHDFPVKITRRPEAGPDGKMYAMVVDREGNVTGVPVEELYTNVSRAAERRVLDAGEINALAREYQEQEVIRRQQPEDTPTPVAQNAPPDDLSNALVDAYGPETPQRQGDGLYIEGYEDATKRDEGAYLAAYDAAATQNAAPQAPGAPQQPAAPGVPAQPPTPEQLEAAARAAQEALAGRGVQLDGELQKRGFLERARGLREQYRALPLWKRAIIGASFAGIGAAGLAGMASGGFFAATAGALAYGTGRVFAGVMAAGAADSMTIRWKNRKVAWGVNIAVGLAAAIGAPRFAVWLADSLGFPTSGAGAPPAAPGAAPSTFNAFNQGGILGARYFGWNILEDRLNTQPDFAGLNQQQKNFVIAKYVKMLEGLSSAEKQALGVPDGYPHRGMHPGQRFPFPSSFGSKALFDQFVAEARGISAPGSGAGLTPQVAGGVPSGAPQIPVGRMIDVGGSQYIAGSQAAADRFYTDKLVSTVGGGHVASYNSLIAWKGPDDFLAHTNDTFGNKTPDQLKEAMRKDSNVRRAVKELTGLYKLTEQQIFAVRGDLLEAKNLGVQQNTVDKTFRALASARTK